MNYKNWEPTYKNILNDFNYSLENDEKGANVLNKILQKNKNVVSIRTLEDLIHGEEIIIFGAGPSLKSSIIKHKKMFIDRIKIAADGATTALLKNNIYPEIIATDLDGKVSDQLKASSEGCVTIIHAHGDNIDNIKKYTPKFKGEIIGTTQSNPVPYNMLHNFGGFTDGDRAAYIADHFYAKEIYLVGFEFNGKIGKYSLIENKDKRLKLKKLEWCKYLINMLNKQNRINYLQN